MVKVVFYDSGTGTITFAGALHFNFNSPAYLDVHENTAPERTEDYIYEKVPASVD